MRVSLLCFLPLLLLTSGCGTTQYSKEARAASFGRLEGVSIGEVAIRDHVLSRTGILFHGADFGSDDPVEASETSQSRTFQVGREIALCAAAAIDLRGYFVSAAHCVEDDEFFLAFPSKNGPIAIKPRIVWAGQPNVFGYDFSILHVPVALDRYFAWAKNPQKLDDVVSGGAVPEFSEPEDGESEFVVSVDPTGGKIVRMLARDRAEVPYQIVLHDSPIVQGFSGGPLVDMGGRLVGINYGGRTRWPIRWNARMRNGNAIRPNLDWLNSVIEADQTELREPEDGG